MAASNFQIKPGDMVSEWSENVRSFPETNVRGFVLLFSPLIFVLRDSQNDNLPKDDKYQLK